ncbi:MAG TPA: molybdate ABC transporter substrate-binding protein [Micropepsaceae bacterium]|jgi:molybdate transport system substrate-binding protein|nr:molybdate ABC transporter substrate-binding protein [Micropepsaceae bacterium]
MKHKFIMAAGAALSLLCASAMANAAEVKVFVGGAMTETVEKIGAAFAKTSGNKLDYVSDTTGALQKRLAAGEKADVVVVTAAGLDALEKENRIAAGTRTPLVRALIGVAMRPNATPPDLSSADALKASLLKARSVSYVNPMAGGTSGTYFEGLMKRMGIFDQMKPKIVYRNQGSEVADAVAKGDAEIGISFIAELAPNKGVKIAGPLPDAIQSPTDYIAAVTMVSGSPDAARGFIQAMTSPSGAAVFKAAGLNVLPAGH